MLPVVPGDIPSGRRHDRIFECSGGDAYICALTGKEIESERRSLSDDDTDEARAVPTDSS